MADPTLPSSRTDFIDPRTGRLSREWYLFFLNLHTGGTNSGESVLVAPDNSVVASKIDELSKTVQGIETSPRYEPESLFTQAGAGAVTRTMQNKARDFISVKDYGAVADAVTDDSAAFQAAIDALPSTGGRIVIPDGNYLLNTTPSIAAKDSIYWDIGTGCVFTGTGTGSGKFPYNATNIAQMAVGPLLQSRTSQKSTHPNGGIQVLGVEVQQPDTYGAGQSVALYAGAYSNNANAAGNVWALNTLINAGPAAGGTYQCIEVDVDCFSASALMKGISISGGGSANPDVGIELTRADTTIWDRGIHIYRSTIGLKIETSSTVSNGIRLGNTANFSNTPFAALQDNVTGDCIVMQRYSSNDTKQFLRCVDEGNTTNVFVLDAKGGIQSQGFCRFDAGLVSTSIVIASGAFSVPAGAFCLGNSTAATATAGAATLPANPVGFWAFFIGSTIYKIPYYAN